MRASASSCASRPASSCPSASNVPAGDLTRNRSSPRVHTATEPMLRNVRVRSSARPRAHGPLGQSYACWSPRSATGLARILARAPGPAASAPPFEMLTAAVLPTTFSILRPPRPLTVRPPPCSRQGSPIGATMRPLWAAHRSRTSAPVSGSDRPRVRLCPGRRCHRRSREQHRGPGSDRQREHVREDERAQSHAGEGRGCPRSVTPRPGLHAPEAADQQNDAPERSRTGARRDRVADDQGAARDRRCGRGAHARQRSAVSSALLDLQDLHPRDRPRDHELLDLGGALEDVVDLGSPSWPMLVSVGECRICRDSGHLAS